MSHTGAIVYVVDDDVSMCKALSVLLKSQEFRVETFTSAEGFLAFKHPKIPSCLVLDYILPNINGLALQEIMAQRGILIPIIFITGHGSIPMTVKAMKAGAIDFLSKPFTNKELLKAITAALALSKVLNQRQAEIAKIKNRISTLSPRELEVFHLVARGMLNKQIASKRGTALQTIKVHRGRVMQKMQAKTVTELIRFAQEAGITSSLD
ncbi:MAG: response regulator transcription factor [Candidatus Omnitrophica bacterium]|nr:response regulator transcription factor [Candidatus Omnitrophota bacterium]